MADLLTARQNAIIAGTMNDLVSGTVGKHPVTFIKQINTTQSFGESPRSDDDPVALTGLVINPTAKDTVNQDRAQVDYDLRIEFSRQYLIDEGVPELTVPGQFDREWEWEVDGLRYTTKAIKADGQFDVNPLIIFVDLEKL